MTTNPAVNDPETLEALYWQEGLSYRQIADRLGVSHATVIKRFHEYGIDKRGVGYNSKDGIYKKYASYRITEYGYPVWELSRIDDRSRTFVHQLVAIANGAEPENVYSENYHTHHENGVKWDNRPENLSVLDAAEHLREHAERGDNAMSKGRYDQYSEQRFPNELREMADEIAENTNLTAREADLVVGYADGFSMTEMTEMLNIAEQGIEARKNRIQEKWAKAENTANVLEDLWG